MHAARARPRARPGWPGFDVAAEPTQVRLRIGVALQEAALDAKQTGVELLRLQGRLYGLSRSDGEPAPRPTCAS